LDLNTRTALAAIKTRAPGFMNKPRNIALVATLLTASLALLVGNRTVIAHIPYYYMQFLPVNALRDDPVRSIAYLHSQLPLENTAFAIIVNLFRYTTADPPYVNDFWKGDTYWIGVVIKQIITLYLYSYALARTFCHLFGKRFGAIGVIIIALLPSSLMYFLFPYSALTSAALYGIIVSIMLCENNAARRLMLAAPCIAALALSHNLFSYLATFPLALIYLADLVANHRKVTKRLMGMSLFVLALPIAWSIKNYLIFDITSLTSWSGCALGQSLTAVLQNQQTVGNGVQDGWASAFKNIQVAPTYHPNQVYDKPIVLNQRMKGEGVRNWNHISVVKSCKESYSYNAQLLRQDPELRRQLLASIQKRFAYSLGRVGSQFNCAGCDFSYKDLGFEWYGRIIEGLYENTLMPAIVSLWHLVLWYGSPAIAGMFFLRSSRPRLAAAMFAVLVVNILQSTMAVSLSTIENERMLWMLDNASMQTLCTAIFLAISSRSPHPERTVQSRTS
jgi:hypothetical protein